MIPFSDWLAVYEPLYGPLADRRLYEIHEGLGESPAAQDYERSVPSPVRRALGEFYTPDWLVKFVLERAGYAGEPMLDPACGAGAFLKQATGSATGWDIHPIAVQMARAEAPGALIEVRDALLSGEGEFGLIAGNPPWVNWRRLGASYRSRIAPLWERYGLFEQRGIKARLGGAMDDLSSLMTYVCADRHLAVGGRLAFILPAALFQSAGGGAGFRRFVLPGGLHLRVVRVDEVEGVDAFAGATTRAAVAVFEKSRTATLYPVLYTRGGVECRAEPVSVDPAAPWAVSAPGDESLDDLRGTSSYVARVGAHTGGAAGVYWVDVLDDRGETLVIRNRFDAGKIRYPQVTAGVERELVHPLVRGRDLRSGSAVASAHIILPHGSDGKPYEESEMRERFPLAFDYFKHFRTQMFQRAHYLRHFAAQRKPYWSMYNVGPYTFARHRVAWREQSSTFQCAVLREGDIADAKLATVTVESAAEASYLAAFLNSERVRAFVEAYVLRTQISTHVMKYLKVPPFIP